VSASVLDRTQVQGDGTAADPVGQIGPRRIPVDRNEAAALLVAARWGPGRRVVTVAVDSDLKYLQDILYD
jgi:hypothetical protein